MEAGQKLICICESSFFNHEFPHPVKGEIYTFVGVCPYNSQFIQISEIHKISEGNLVWFSHKAFAIPDFGENVCEQIEKTFVEFEELIEA